MPCHNIRFTRSAFFDEQGRQTDDDAKVDYVILDLVRNERSFRCPCGYTTDYYYDMTERQVRDLPWGPWREVFVLVPRYRVDCPRCGVKTEALDWIVPNCTYTRRLAEAVALACREIRSIAAIAEAFGLSWDTVKQIDKTALRGELNPPDFSGLRRLGLDEFSLKKRHRYATSFVDLDSRRVIWVCWGREQKAIEHVFDQVFGKAVCAGIETVSMDMWEPYELAVKAWLPNAEIVWDLFHIIKNYNREVMDRVRIDEANKCQDQAERKLFKGSKWLVIKNQQNLRDDEPARLAELLAANQNLAKAYILRDVLKQCWTYRDAAGARTWFAGWLARASGSRIKPLAHFARKLKTRLLGELQIRPELWRTADTRSATGCSKASTT
ncbi:ISL3 family transposase [Candidatus Sumerlaeota bacterium]